MDSETNVGPDPPHAHALSPPQATHTFFRKQESLIPPSDSEVRWYGMAAWHPLTSAGSTPS